MSNPERGFDTEAVNWDENPAKVKLAEETVAAIAKEVALNSKMDVLDFGCATGLITLRIAPRVGSITGVDSSQTMLDALRQKVRMQGCENVSARHVEPGDEVSGCYDVIIVSMTLHHIEHVKPLLGQMYEALRSPGYLCVVDLDPDDGEFHKSDNGVFHCGFERPSLRQSLVESGFSRVKDVSVAEVTKPARSGALRNFSVFLMVGEKVSG